MFAKIIKFVLKPLAGLLLAAAIAFSFLVAGVRLLGVELYTILSPSMEPNYHTGALIYVKETDPAELQVRDVITFRLDETTTATHRIIEVLHEDGLQFRTQGDANDIPDTNPVDAADVIGTPVLHIPYLGYAASYVQNPPGLYAAIAIFAAIVFIVLIVDILDGVYNPKTDKKAKADNSNRKETEA